MRFLSLIVLTFVTVLAVTFAILNSDAVAVHYYFGTRYIPLALLMLGVWILGVLVGVGVSYFKIFKLKLALRRQQH